MNLSKKKTYLLLISLLIICVEIIYFGLNKTDIFELVYGLSIAIISMISIYLSKKNTFVYAVILSVYSYLGSVFMAYLLALSGIILSLIPTKEETKLSTFVKNKPILASFCCTIIGLGILHYTVVVEFLASLRDGINMMCELLAIIGLVLLIKLCKKMNIIKDRDFTIKESLAVGLPVILFIIIMTSYQLVSYSSSNEFLPFWEILATCMLYIFIGIFEELLMRGLVLNVLTDKYNKTAIGIWGSLTLSSLFFGLAHLNNITTGASFLGVLVQVIMATAAGMYFGAIYLRTNNIWLVCLIHGFWDLMASIMFLFKGIEYDYGEIISGYSTSNLIPVFGYLFLTIFLLRKSKMKKMIAKNKGEEIPKDKKTFFSVLLKITYIILTIFAVVIGISVLFAPSLINEKAIEKYNELMKDYDYQYEGNFLFTKDTKFTELNPEIKMLLVLESQNDKEDFSVAKEYVDDKYKELYNEEVKDYVVVRIDATTNCNYSNNEYKCKKVANNKTFNTKVYIGIKNIRVDYQKEKVYVDIYYLLEEESSKSIYGDSAMTKTLYTNTSINEITKVKYDENDSYNKEFFDSIDKKSIYTLELDIDPNTSDLSYSSISNLDNKNS